MSRILVIDDELSLRQLLRSMLERVGHTVFDAPDGREGMALWHREPTDIVVTDVFMPEKDGIEVILEMKKVAVRPKIIAMSGGGRKGLLDWSSSALAVGADRVLLKPFDQKTFLSAVQELLQGQPDVTDTAISPGASDQRKHRRFSIFLPVWFDDGVVAEHGTIVDISREGGRIKCVGTVPDMKYFQLKIQLDDPHHMLAVDLAVMRWSGNGEFGIEFIRMESAQQARLQNLIRSCEAAGSRLDHCRDVQQSLFPVAGGGERKGPS